MQIVSSETDTHTTFSHTDCNNNATIPKTTISIDDDNDDDHNHNGDDDSNCG